MPSPTVDQLARLTNEETDMVADADVLGHIQRKNDERNALAKAEGWEWWTSIAETLAGDYDNVYQLEWDLMSSSYSDIHKEIYGVRPRGYSKDMTLSELSNELEEMTDQEGVYTT